MEASDGGDDALVAHSQVDCAGALITRADSRLKMVMSVSRHHKSKKGKGHAHVLTLFCLLRAEQN